MSIRNLISQPFPLGWYGFELEGYRSCDSTYCWFSYDSLPPLPDTRFLGNFEWLTPLEPHLISEMEQYWLPYEEQLMILKNLEKLKVSAKEKGIPFPEPFITFMGNLEFQKRIPSCTACYFDLRDQLITCPVNKDNISIRFLNDQQGVFAWYLYLTPTGEHYVVASRSWFDLLSLNDQEFTNEDYSEAFQSTLICAQSFEEFLYRFWLENSIWFVLTNKHRKLTADEQNYLRHYVGD